MSKYDLKLPKRTLSIFFFQLPLSGALHDEIDLGKKKLINIIRLYLKGFELNISSIGDQYKKSKFLCNCKMLCFLWCCLSVLLFRGTIASVLNLALTWKELTEIISRISTLFFKKLLKGLTIADSWSFEEPIVYFYFGKKEAFLMYSRLNIYEWETRSVPR